MMPRWALDAWLSAMFRGQSLDTPAEHYVALFKGDPGQDGAKGEISAPGYARQRVSFTPPREGVIENEKVLEFGKAPEAWGAVTHLAVFDAQVGGRMLWSAELDEYQDVKKHGRFEIEAGWLRIDFGNGGPS